MLTTLGVVCIPAAKVQVVVLRGKRFVGSGTSPTGRKERTTGGFGHAGVDRGRWLSEMS
jgi:hypothetical protein